jgi:putative phage-type endonuclease
MAATLTMPTASPITLPPFPLTPKQTEAERKAAWLEDRRTCLTGSEIGAVLGVHPFVSPIDVYLSKRGTAMDREVTEAMEFGTRFERPILEAYADRFGQAIQFADHWTLHRVAGFPLLGASLDARWLTGDRRPVDAKNVGFRQKNTWGEFGSDQFPDYYQAQLAVQMMACDEPGYTTEAADLAVCFSGNKLGRYTLHRDLETDAIIQEMAEKWWKRHVLADVPPDPDGSEAYSNYLKQRFARNGETLLAPTDAAQGWARDLVHVRGVLEDAEQREEQIIEHLKLICGSAAGILGVCTWKNNKDSQVTDYKAIAEELKIKVLPDEYAELLKDNTRPKPGPRVFRFTCNLPR